MDDVVSMLLAVGSTLRLTRLASTDVITEPLRRPLSGWVLKLVTCGWCASVWIAFGIVVPTWWIWGHTRIWQAVALALIASWAAGVTHNLGSQIPKPITVSTRTPVNVIVDQVPDLDVEYDDDGDV